MNAIIYTRHLCPAVAHTHCTVIANMPIRNMIIQTHQERLSQHALGGHLVSRHKESRRPEAKSYSRYYNKLNMWVFKISNYHQRKEISSLTV